VRTLSPDGADPRSVTGLCRKHILVAQRDRAVIPSAGFDGGGALDRFRRSKDDRRRVAMSYEEPVFLVGASETIKQGGQPISVVADLLVEFIDRAKHTIHIAIYDFRLSDEPTAKKVLGALTKKAAGGVEVQIAYDHRNAPKFGAGDDPAPHGTHAFLTKHLSQTKVQLKPVGIGMEAIAGSKLMHSKFVVVDGKTASAAVWMGSTNFTDDAWTKQDNNILRLDSKTLAGYYETDFNELWTKGSIVGTGAKDFGTVNQDGLDLDVSFSPVEGKRTDAEIAKLISGAKTSVHIASMVITSDSILAALAQIQKAGKVKLVGIYDGPEMKSATAQTKSQVKLEQIAALEKMLVAKNSHPYSDAGIHDFMHNKIVVVDDALITGSHNFSLSAEQNAENALLIRNPQLAAKYRTYIESLVKRYGH
jgi:phosphatidylserine/phosphatidylglycerophosphate/cardiolipin synthase-like enzyme